MTRLEAVKASMLAALAAVFAQHEKLFAREPSGWALRWKSLRDKDRSYVAPASATCPVDRAFLYSRREDAEGVRDLFLRLRADDLEVVRVVGGKAQN